MLSPVVSSALSLAVSLLFCYTDGIIAIFPVQISDTRREEKTMKHTEAHPPGTDRAVSNPEVRLRAERHFRIKVAINAVLVVLGSVFIGLFLLQMQNHLALAKQRQASEAALDAALGKLETNRDSADALAESFHMGNQAVLDDISLLLSNESLTTIMLGDDLSAEDLTADILSRSGADVLLLMRTDGETVFNSSVYRENPDPVREGLMTQEELKTLLKGTRDKDNMVHPVKTARYSTLGAFFYYSRPFFFHDRSYVLVIGADATQLGEQMESIRDVAQMLRQENGQDKVFSFAANPETDTFLFYENGDVVRTGQSIREAGLSDAVLTDGHAGIATIDGCQYYCTCKSCDETTLLCSAARLDGVYAENRSVLFWSVLSFVLIMVICLAYSVVVRNDFVNRAVVTDRIALKRIPGRELYFDKSVFRKIFPLMVLSVLVLYGISFYVQTMVELSEALNRSREIASGISSMYGDNVADRDAVQGYYNNQFIAKAELISFLLETDPSALNAPSDFYHFSYDKNGVKQFAVGAQGQRVRSVGSSALLQNLCDTNGIKSVYIFDEDGRTIGTSTSNWYFTISHEEEDQSYEFLQVLDGRTDSLVQAPMEDDLGESSQYVGVSFHYYTKEEKNGDIVYVSRYKANAPGVTAHRSMIQIGVDAEKMEALQQATNFTYLMPSFIMDSGYVMMYDKDEAHHCLYSLVPESIGKTAEELEVPEKAFRSDSFCKLQGFGPYGQVIIFQQSGGYHFEIHLFRGSVFRNRGLVALTTSLIAFLLILILCATVTLTSREEEALYADAFWTPERFRWFSGNPEEKLLRMVRIVAAILVVSVLLALQVAELTYDEHSMVRFVLGSSWDRGLNLFAFSKSALVLLSVLFAVALIRVPLLLLPSLFGARGETIGHLLSSLVKYGGALAALFYTMYLFGVNSSELLASAGLLTLIIGFGSQSLIKDIISGLFIVFEGEFQVGDIVTIHGYRGVVHDIGLRTTKVLGIDDETGNLKVFSNSEITEVLNMTYQLSQVVCKISIEYGQDLAYVEAVLKRELPVIAAATPEIVTGPFFRGVEKLGDSGVVIGIYVMCNEQDAMPVSRLLNRSILELFYRYDINIPFPNLTISQLDTSGQKTLDDLPAAERSGKEG